MDKIVVLIISQVLLVVVITAIPNGVWCWFERTFMKIPDCPTQSSPLLRGWTTFHPLGAQNAKRSRRSLNRRLSFLKCYDWGHTSKSFRAVSQDSSTTYHTCLMINWWLNMIKSLYVIRSKRLVHVHPFRGAQWCTASHPQISSTYRCGT